jgi:precorrin-6B methylase 2/NOL1/NOP2/fmu family ribosome biogenesis protein
MCAAPGNKSAQIGVRLQNQGSIVSNDRSKRRLQMLRRIFSRLGIANGTITARDAANYARDAGQFDKVLVDAPCSCQGNSRKMSAINQGWFRPEYSVKTSRLQRAILRKAVHKCRPGGRIVYSTCTYAPEENEAVVHDILEEMRGDGIEIVPASIPGFSTAPGLTSFEGQQWSKEMTHCMRVWPHLNDTGGFFVAVLEKKITGRAHFAMPGVTPQDNRFERFEADTVDEEAREQWAFVRERFGLDEEMLSEYQLLRPATRRMYLYPRASQGLRAPEPENQGLILMRVNGKFSKFSTDAAMFFGRKLQRNVMELNDEQLPLYLSRETCFPEAEQMERCTIGPVVIRYRGEPLGTGFWRPHEDSAAVDVEGAGELLSRFPKAWSQEYKDTAANNTGKKRQTRAPRPQKPSTPQCCPD